MYFHYKGEPVITCQPNKNKPGSFQQGVFDTNQSNTSYSQQGRDQPKGPPLAPVIAAITGVSPGLEYLSQADQLLVHHQVKSSESYKMAADWQIVKKYEIKNVLGQQVYFAAEESDTCARIWFGHRRGFVMHLTDNLGAEVMRATRKFKCFAGCNCCANTNQCAMLLAVEVPVGQICGYARQSQSCIAPRYTIMDANMEPVYKIEGPTCPCQSPCCTQDLEFKVFTLQDLLVGNIYKQWAGIAREFFTYGDNFLVHFPNDIDVQMKAVLLCTVFLIDFMYFGY